MDRIDAKSSVFLIFVEDIDTNALCKVELNQDDLEQLRHSIEELFYFEFVVGM